MWLLFSAFCDILSSFEFVLLWLKLINKTKVFFMMLHLDMSDWMWFCPIKGKKIWPPTDLSRRRAPCWWRQSYSIENNLANIQVCPLLRNCHSLVLWPYSVCRVFVLSVSFCDLLVYNIIENEDFRIDQLFLARMGYENGAASYLSSYDFIENASDVCITKRE